MRQALNPYLPFWETVPDAEPHVFGDRVYVYGSHDELGGSEFCVKDYVCWSAPVDNLADWKYEGVIYRKDQDPINGAHYYKELPEYEDIMKGSDRLHCLYAPDVCRGKDGKYYLYYALDFCDIISVAVSDSPAGPFEFLDYVLDQNGNRPAIGRNFDPAILVENDGNYLYYGFCPAFKFPGMEEQKMPGLMMVKLADDMHTVISEPVLIVNGIDTCKDTSFEKHPALEASSIRHIGEWYYFVYSSLQGHELCYAMSKSPAGPFEFKGVIVSNGDIGLNGSMEPVNYWGNNHGGLEVIGDKTYIFWHRQTHATEYSRQGCADEVHIQPDGTIPQIEITSCGLNGGPLRASEMYSAHIACNLTGKSILESGNYSQGDTIPGHVLSKAPDDPAPLVIPDEMPYITEEACQTGEHNLKPFINNMGEGAVAGFKFFNFDGESRAMLEIRGKGNVSILLDDKNGTKICQINVESDDWKIYEKPCSQTEGVHSVYVKIDTGNVQFAQIGFAK